MLLHNKKKGIKIITSKSATHDVFYHYWESNCLQQRSISSVAHLQARSKYCVYSMKWNKPHHYTIESLIHKMKQGASFPSYLFKSTMQHNSHCLQTSGRE